MPGLKKSGIIANNRLTFHFAKNVFAPVPRMPSLWAHAHFPIMFYLVVNDISVKYTGAVTAHHFIAALRSLYTISANWYGSLFCGVTLARDYANWTVYVSMPFYIDKALQKFWHPHPKRRQDAPPTWKQPVYCTKVQYEENLDNYPALPPKTIHLVQQIIGTLLYYVIAFNVTMFVALGSIAATQSHGTNKTYDETLWFLNYAGNHPDVTIS